MCASYRCKWPGALSNDCSVRVMYNRCDLCTSSLRTHSTAGNKPHTPTGLSAEIERTSAPVRNPWLCRGLCLARCAGIGFSECALLATEWRCICDTWIHTRTCHTSGARNCTEGRYTMAVMKSPRGDGSCHNVAVQRYHQY